MIDQINDDSRVENVDARIAALSRLICSLRGDLQALERRVGVSNHNLTRIDDVVSINARFFNLQRLRESEECSEQRQTKENKRWIIAIVAILILAAIAVPYLAHLAGIIK